MMDVGVVQTTMNHPIIFNPFSLLPVELTLEIMDCLDPPTLELSIKVLNRFFNVLWKLRYGGNSQQDESYPCEINLLIATAEKKTLLFKTIEFNYADLFMEYVRIDQDLQQDSRLWSDTLQCFCTLAAAKEDAQILKYILGPLVPLTRLVWISPLSSASEKGHNEVVRLLLSIIDERIISYSYKPCERAAANGRIDTLKLLIENGYPYSSSAYDYAAKGGHLAILKWLREISLKNNRLNILDYWTMAGAAEGGHLDILIWLKQQGCEWNEMIGNDAAEYGQFDILKWLKNEFKGNGQLWTITTCCEAAKNGHLDILKWLIEDGCPKNELLFMYAAKSGRLDIVEYLREIRCPWDSRACDAAAENGHFEILQWLVKNECSVGSNVFEYAALNGHLEILKWYVAESSNRCDLKLVNKHTCINIAKNGHIHVLEWLYENVCHMREEVFVEALRYEKFGVLKLVAKCGLSWTNIHHKYMMVTQ